MCAAQCFEPAICERVRSSLVHASWYDRAWPGGFGTESQWDVDGELFHEARERALDGIDPLRGVVHVEQVADAIDRMAATEDRWSDHPATRSIQRTIIRCLGWTCTPDEVSSRLRAGALYIPPTKVASP